MSSEAMGMRSSYSSSSAGGGAGYNDWDSSRKEERSNSYEDDYCDGEHEDSEVESNEPRLVEVIHSFVPNKKINLFRFPSNRYSDQPPSARAASEKANAINVSVNPKSLSSGVVTSAPTKASQAKVAKKIDMGAAANYGVDSIGIHSPTHRNTHAEENLFEAIPSSSTVGETKTDLLDDLFQTCSPPPANDQAVKVSTIDEDDFFNPREGDREPEFGDFASAFGNNVKATPVAPVPVVPVASPIATQKDEFADFTSAFTSAASTPAAAQPINSPSPSLVATNGANANIQTNPSSAGVGDLLSDLDGLTLNPTTNPGKLTNRSTIFCLLILVDKNENCASFASNTWRPSILLFNSIFSVKKTNF